MKKRVISLGLVAAMLLSAVGCSNNATSTPSSTVAPTQPPAETSTTSEEPAPTQTSTDSSPVTIRFATWDVGVTAYWRAIFDAFQTANPNIKVDPLEISSNEYNDKIRVMLAGGEDVDVVDIKELNQYMSYVNAGQLDPLDDRIKADNVDMAGYGGLEKPLYIDDKLYSLPYRSDIHLLYYNKTLLESLGVSLPTNDMTLDQFRELAKAATKGEGADKKYGAIIHTWPSQVYSYGIAAGEHTLLEGNYDFLLPYYKTITAMQNEDESVPDFAELRTANVHYSASFGAQQQGSMLMMGTWYISRLISEMKDGTIQPFEWGIVKMPHDPAVSPGHTVGGVTPLSINAKSKNKDAAWEFIKFTGTKEGAKVLAGMGTYTGYQDDEIRDIFTNMVGFPADGKAALETDGIFLEFPPHPQGAAMKQIIEEEHQMIMVGEVTPEQGIKSMNDRVDEVMKEAR